MNRNSFKIENFNFCNTSVIGNNEIFIIHSICQYVDLKKLESIVITGGAGFIGSHIAEKLILNGNEVTVIDNLSAGNIKNLDFCKGNKKFCLIRDDLSRSIKLLKLLKDVDIVLHLAADPEVRTGYENPEIAYRENIQNTFHLLENIRKSNVKKIVFASSSVVYGEPTIIPTPETYGPLLPISQYGGSKLACEALISSYCNNYGIKGVIIRLANVIGSRSNHGIIWDFINKLKKNNKELQYLGDGKQTKSYIHVYDCVAGFLFCLKNTSRKIDVFNIGNDDKIDVLSIAKIVCKNMNLKNTKIISKGGTKDGRGWIGDVKQMQLDISKLRDLGWYPRLSSMKAVELASKELIRDISIK